MEGFTDGMVTAGNGLAAPSDGYYSRKNGKYLGSDGQVTTVLRLIDNDVFDRIRSSNGTSSAKATALLRQASIRVIIDSSKLQFDLQRVRDLSMSGFENQMIIVLDLEHARITSFMGSPGTNNTSEFYYYDAPSLGANMPSAQDGSRMVHHILIGVAHGHPDSRLPNVETESTISPGNDLPVAVYRQIAIYGVDAMLRTGGVGTPGKVHRANPDGTISNNIGETMGQGPVTFDIGADAMKVWGKSGSPRIEKQPKSTFTDSIRAFYRKAR